MRPTEDHHVESIKRLAMAQWLILDAMLGNCTDEIESKKIEALKQLAEEIDDKCDLLEASPGSKEE